jgi:ABC-type branched-subunit amino acid transport system substrate-binding protein
VSVANKMFGEGVKFVIGHFNSGVTMPASEVYQENGIYMITPSATNPKITERGMWNVFRTCGRDDQQGEVAGALHPWRTSKARRSPSSTTRRLTDKGPRGRDQESR